VVRLELAADIVRLYWLVEPIEAFVDLPESPPADICCNHAVPYYFLADGPESSLEPGYRMEQVAAMPAELVVIEERAARLRDSE